MSIGDENVKYVSISNGVSCFNSHYVLNVFLSEYWAETGPKNFTLNDEKIVTFVTLTQEINNLFLILFISLKPSQLLVFYFSGTVLKFGSTCCLIQQQWTETDIHLAFSVANFVEFLS